MYYGLSGYKELYQRAKKHHLPEKCVEELGRYRNSIFNLVEIFDLFSDEHDNKESCKYMENIIRLLTRYQIDDNIINKSLVDVIGHKSYNLDYIFYALYSIMEPKEMERISLKEYITDFYHILLNNFAYKQTKEELDILFNDININKLKDLLLYLNNSRLPKILEENFYPKLYLLGIITSYIYLNDLDFSLIDTYINNYDYYYNKLVLNGIVRDGENNTSFFMFDHIQKYLFYGIESFINDNSNSKRYIK